MTSRTQQMAFAFLIMLLASQAVLFASIGVTAAGSLLLLCGSSYAVALTAALLIGAGLAAGFPVVLSYVGDLYPSRSGTAFSNVFFVALIGNMSINKGFGMLAQSEGLQLYPKVMLACLAGSAIFLGLVVRQLPKRHSQQNITNEQHREAVAR